MTLSYVVKKHASNCFLPQIFLSVFITQENVIDYSFIVSKVRKTLYLIKNQTRNRIIANHRLPPAIRLSVSDQ